jgi:trimethylamine--corrinoid protein Co-methyltransferase
LVGYHLKDVLSRDQLYNLHLATVELLENTGVSFQHKKILDLFKSFGAKVDYKKSIVKIPEHLVKEATLTFLLRTPHS